MLAQPAGPVASPSGEEQRCSITPCCAAWLVKSGAAPSYDRVSFRMLYVYSCGDAGVGLIKHPERVLGLPQG